MLNNILPYCQKQYKYYVQYIYIQHMKHIKIYEEVLDRNYKIGEIIVLSEPDDMDKNKGFKTKHFVK